MVEGFEVVMNKINTVVPRIEEEQERVSEIVDSLKDHIPSLNTQQRDLHKRSEAISSELDSQRKRQKDIANLVSSLFEEVNDIEEQYGFTLDTFEKTQKAFEHLEKELRTEQEVLKDKLEAG